MQADVIFRTFVAAPAETVTVASSEIRKRSRSRRAVFLTWLRNTHLYVGLWGALLGLLFGATGILLNHRSIMKIPVEKTVQKTAQLPLPVFTLTSPQQMAA